MEKNRVAPRGATLSPTRREGRATDELAKKYGISERTMRRGKKVVDHATAS